MKDRIQLTDRQLGQLFSLFSFHTTIRNNTLSAASRTSQFAKGGTNIEMVLLDELSEGVRLMVSRVSKNPNKEKTK